MDVVTFSFDEIRSAVRGEWIGDFDGSQKITAIFTDTRESVPDSLFVAFTGENFDAHDFLGKAVENGAKLLCVEKNKVSKLPAGVPAIAVDSTVGAYQALAHAHRMRFPGLKLLAVTGSCGKTSTKETLRAILIQAYGKEHVLATEGNTNNQIGVPRNLFRLTKEHHAAVIEMGTNHPGEIFPLARCAEPSGAMIVSIGNCHLEFLGSLEGVATEKANIFSYLPQGGRAVIPSGAAGFDIMKAAAFARTLNVVSFGTDHHDAFCVHYLGGNINGASFELFKHATGEKTVVQWHVPGEHQARNAAGAAALADSLGIPFDTIAKGIENTTLPGMRMRVAEHLSATWINDAYNANPDSMKASLNWLAEFADGNKLILALGDMGELGENSHEGHRSVLLRAMELFPSARLVLVGPKMKAAAGSIPG